MKFNRGDRVVLSMYGDECFVSQRFRNGIVVGGSRMAGCVAVLRDGTKTPRVFHEDYWALDVNPPQPAPCPTCARYMEALERIVAASDDPDLYDQCGNIARKALATDAAERGEA